MLVSFAMVPYRCLAGRDPVLETLRDLVPFRRSAARKLGLHEPVVGNPALDFARDRVRPVGMSPRLDGVAPEHR
jgi:hypothetical protein